jgi:hypothetical protein
VKETNKFVEPEKITSLYPSLKHHHAAFHPEFFRVNPPPLVGDSQGLTVPEYAEAFLT